MPPLVHYHPAAPVATEYRVGLCAWQDKSMLDEGSFYPIKSMKAEERLWWYSRFFDSVEVNSTFYAPLSAQNAVLWAKRTPPGFLFSVKAYALLTGHHLDAGRLPRATRGNAARRRGAGRARPARQRRVPRGGPRVGVRRPSARRSRRSPTRASSATSCSRWRRGSATAREALDYLAALRDRLPGITVAVEFRDASWLPGHTDEVLRFLAEHGLTYVSVDAPHTPANVSSDVALTSPVAVIRLHGRNTRGLHEAAPRAGRRRWRRSTGISTIRTGDRGDRRPRPRPRRAGEPHLLRAEQQCRRCPRHQRRSRSRSSWVRTRPTGPRSRRSGEAGAAAAGPDQP